MVERVRVLGVPVDVLCGLSEAVDAVEALVERDDGRARAVLAVNPEKVMAARDDPALLKTLDDAGLLIPDGIGVVLALRWLKRKRARRVPGVELMDALCHRAAERGWPVFLLGAKADTNAAAAEALARRIPELSLAGRRDGYFAKADEAGVIEAINASGAKLLFVALGSPKQELWMREHAAHLDVRICQGVGGSFDVLAGNVRRAPALFRRLNLEWFYRLASQPSRLFRQRALATFSWLVIKERFGFGK